MNRFKTLLAGLERNDVGLVLLASGLCLIDIPIALAVIGSLMILDTKKLRSFF